MEEKLKNNNKVKVEETKRNYRPRNNKTNIVNKEGEKTKKITKKSKGKKQVEQFKFKKEKLKIIPLGGLLEIGKNITVFEYENDIISEFVVSEEHREGRCGHDDDEDHR